MKDDELHDLLEYSPETGMFRWKIRRSNACKHGWFYGSKTRGGYFQIQINKKWHRAHRLAWFLNNGSWPSGVIDHIDRNVTNNKIENLRDIPHQANLLNNKAKGIKKHGKRWTVTITDKGKHTYVGIFKEEDEAKKVYEAHKKQKFEQLTGLPL